MTDKNDTTRFTEGNEAAVTHGLYSYQATGELPEARQTPAAVTRLEQIRDNLATVEGLEIEQEGITEQAIMAVNLALSWVEKKRGEGAALDDIRVYRMVPALLNTAGRQIKQLIELKEKAGKGNDALDYAELIKQLEEQGE